MANAAFEIFKMMNVRKEEPKKVIITTYNPYREKEENERQVVPYDKFILWRLFGSNEGNTE